MLSPGVGLAARAGGAVGPSARENPSPDAEGADGDIHTPGWLTTDETNVKALVPAAVQRSTADPFMVMSIIVVTDVMDHGGTPICALPSITHSGRSVFPNVELVMDTISPQRVVMSSRNPAQRPDPSFVSHVTTVSPKLIGGGFPPPPPGSNMKGNHLLVPLTGPRVKRNAVRIHRSPVQR